MPHILSFSLSDASVASASYDALLVAYLEGRLGAGTDRATIDLIIAKADRRFAYVSFIADRIEQRHLRLEDVALLGRGDAIYRDWLKGLDAIHGHKRADALRWLLALLVAGEAAQAWVLGPGIAPDPVGGASLVQFRGQGFEGFSVDALAQLSGQFNADVAYPADRYEPQLVLDLQEIQGALWIARAGDGRSRYRIALKEFGAAAAADPQLGPILARASGELAARTLDAAEALKEAEDAPPPSDAALFEELLPYLGGAIAGADAADQPILAARRRALNVAGLMWSRSGAVGKRSGPEALVAWWSLAMAEVMDDRESEAPEFFLTERYRIITDALVDQHYRLTAYLDNRGHAKNRSVKYGLDAALADFDASITLRDNFRTRIGDVWLEWTGLRKETATAYTARAEIKRIHIAYSDQDTLADYTTAIAMLEDLRAYLGTRWRSRTNMRDDLAEAYSLRGNFKLNSAPHGPDAAIADLDVAVSLREELHADLGTEWHLNAVLRGELIQSYINRGIAREYSKSHGLASAMLDYDLAVKAGEGAQEDFGANWRDQTRLRNVIANAHMSRGIARWLLSSDGVGGAIEGAIEDYNAAIGLREDLRVDLGPNWRQNAKLRDDLAKAYANRGNARLKSKAHGADAAIDDHNQAISLREDLRADLGEAWHQNLELRESLALSYSARGQAKMASAAHGVDAALPDLDAAIKLREDLRASLRAEWRNKVDLRYTLAHTYMLRGAAKLKDYSREALSDFDAALSSWTSLRQDLAPEVYAQYKIPKRLISLRFLKWSAIVFGFFERLFNKR